MELTIENIYTNKQAFTTMLDTITTAAKLVDSKTSITLNMVTITMDPDQVILTHDKSDIDPLDDVIDNSDPTEYDRTFEEYKEEVIDQSPLDPNLRYDDVTLTRNDDEDESAEDIDSLYNAY